MIPPHPPLYAAHLPPGQPLPLPALAEPELPLPVGGGLLVGGFPHLHATVGLLQLCLSLRHLLLQSHGRRLGADGRQCYLSVGTLSTAAEAHLLHGELRDEGHHLASSVPNPALVVPHPPCHLQCYPSLGLRPLPCLLCQPTHLFIEKLFLQ